MNKVLQFKPSINLHIKKFWLNFGWYPGDPFKLLSLTIGEASEFRGKVDFISIFDLQLLGYLSLAFGLD